MLGAIAVLLAIDTTGVAAPFGAATAGLDDTEIRVGMGFGCAEAVCSGVTDEGGGSWTAFAAVCAFRAEAAGDDGNAIRINGRAASGGGSAPGLTTVDVASLASSTKARAVLVESVSFSTFVGFTLAALVSRVLSRSTFVFFAAFFASALLAFLPSGSPDGINRESVRAGWGVGIVAATRLISALSRPILYAGK